MPHSEFDASVILTVFCNASVKSIFKFSHCDFLHLDPLRRGEPYVPALYYGYISCPFRLESATGGP